MRRTWLGILSVALIGAACAFPFRAQPMPDASSLQAAGSSPSDVPSAFTSTGTPGPGVKPNDLPTTPPNGKCVTAPQVVIGQVSGGLTVRGAYISNAYVSRATDVAASAVQMEDPWWLAARINGVGVQPELGVWLVDGLTGASQVLNANASAGRYTTFDAGPSDLSASSDTVAGLAACVGPLPKT
jgi:hypothetical protein